jgi:glyoxylase-like metal-dependent hydrolase (beta-lactamase superfamily II)
MSAERDAALVQTGFRARRRYRPRQFNDIHNWKCYTPAGANWNGFETVRELDGLPPEILMVPLPGHTRGHAGIAIDTGRGWLLHAGDAYFYRGEMGSPERHCTIGLRLYQRMMEVDRPKRLHNQERLRELSLNTRANVQIICAHDAIEYEACLRASASGPTFARSAQHR